MTNWIKRLGVTCIATIGLSLSLVIVLRTSPSLAQVSKPSRLDVVFLVDNSHSIGYKNNVVSAYDPGEWRWRAVRLFRDYMRALDISSTEVRIGYVIFAGKVITATSLTPVDQLSLPQYLDETQRFSDLLTAFEKAGEILDEKDRKGLSRGSAAKVIILLSDAHPCTERIDEKDIKRNGCDAPGDVAALREEYYPELAQKLAALRKQGIYLYVLNIAGWIEKYNTPPNSDSQDYYAFHAAFWEEQTKLSGGEYKLIRRSDDIFLAFQRLVQRFMNIRQQYIGVMNERFFNVSLLEQSKSRQLALVFLHSEGIKDADIDNLTIPVSQIVNISGQAQTKNRIGNLEIDGYEIHAFGYPSSYLFTASITNANALPASVWMGMVPSEWELCHEAVVMYEGATPVINVRLLRDGVSISDSSVITGFLESEDGRTTWLSLTDPDGDGSYRGVLPTAFRNGKYHLSVAHDGIQVSFCFEITKRILPTPAVGKIERRLENGLLTVTLPFTYHQGLTPPTTAMTLTKDGAPVRSDCHHLEEGGLVCTFDVSEQGSYELTAVVNSDGKTISRQFDHFVIPGPTPTPHFPTAKVSIEPQGVATKNDKNLKITLAYSTPAPVVPIIRLAETPVPITPSIPGVMVYTGTITRPIGFGKYRLVGENVILMGTTTIEGWPPMLYHWLSVIVLGLLAMVLGYLVFPCSHWLAEKKQEKSALEGFDKDWDDGKIEKVIEFINETEKLPENSQLRQLKVAERIADVLIASLKVR